MKCNKCDSSKVRSRKNYSHGNKSKSITTLSCRQCNSNDILSSPAKFKKKR